jgi:hypothetical protein
MGSHPAPSEGNPGLSEIGGVAQPIGGPKNSCRPELSSASLTIGMMEYWNNGMVGIEDQNEYNDIDFLVIVVYFLGQK